MRRVDMGLMLIMLEPSPFDFGVPLHRCLRGATPLQLRTARFLPIVSSNSLDHRVAGNVHGQLTQRTNKML
jgi:hypothetical protein